MIGRKNKGNFPRLRNQHTKEGKRGQELAF